MKLVAKLKAVFDRFDNEKNGRLCGESVEQALLYMNRPVDSHQVSDVFLNWLTVTIYTLRKSIGNLLVAVIWFELIEIVWYFMIYDII